MTNRVLLGNRGASYGLWISKAGFDVTDTALNTANLLFEPGGRTIRILKQGSVSLPSGGTNVISFSYGMTPPANSGPIVYSYREGALRDSQNNSLWMSMTTSSTGGTITRMAAYNSIAFTFYWMLVTEVGRN